MFDVDVITCISYGLGSVFNSAVMQPIKNKNFKPLGGLWGSPINSKSSWKNFVIEEGLSSKSLDTSFKWTFKGRLLVILDNEEWEDVLAEYPLESNPEFMDWEAIASDYDGAFVFSEVDFFDCNSILVFNPECVFI